MLPYVSTLSNTLLDRLQIYRKKHKEAFMALRCRTLSDFIWYKDTFLTRIYKTKQCNKSSRKKKFLSGLPKLFAEQIRFLLWLNNHDILNLYNYTYGDFIQIINRFGLKLCNDIKLKNQLKQQQISSSKELSDFFYQFGYDPIQTPRRKPPRIIPLVHRS